MPRHGRPHVTRSGTSIRVRHKEFLREISPSVVFTMQVEEPVNPGLEQLFPWISQLARNFESYKFNKLSFYFKSTSADSVLGASGSTALGSVFMAAQYNVLMPPYQNKKEMLNGATVKSTKPSRHMSFQVKTAGITKKLSVRADHTDISSNEVRGDRRLYDLCDFHLATEGCQATTGVIGELYVYADITFTTPTIQDRDADWALFSYNSVYNLPLTQSPMSSQVLDPNRATTDHSNIKASPLTPNALASARIEAQTIVATPVAAQAVPVDKWALGQLSAGGQIQTPIGTQLWTFIPGDEMSNALDHVFLFRLAIQSAQTNTITSTLVPICTDCKLVTFVGDTNFQLPSGFGISHSFSSSNSKMWFVRIIGEHPKITFDTDPAAMLAVAPNANFVNTTIAWVLITLNGNDGNWA